MSWSFWLSLSLSYLPIIGSVRNTVNCSSISQPNQVTWRNTGQSASLPCTFDSGCSAVGIQYQWFAFKERFHHQLNLATRPLKYSLDGASLHIKSLDRNDSGIYHCAAVFSGPASDAAQMIGPGTTLIVTEAGMQVVWHILLWLLFVLLAIYSLAIIIVIVLKRNGRNVRICRGICMTPKNNSTKRMKFRAVLEELHTGRNLESSTQKAGSRDFSQNKAESTQSNPSTDDIYENL